MYEYLIYDRLTEYKKADKAYHMPGHKSRGEFKNRFPVAPFDITELPYSDNLLCPAGIIADAQKDLAKIVGAKKSYILTDGSTSGVFSIVYALSKFGKKIIIPRTSHASVWNACKILGVEPVVAHGKYKDGVLLPPSAAEVEKLVSEDVEICGMLALSPDYYGNVAPLEEYPEILKSRGCFLATDGAHGAHLVFGNDKKLHAGGYSDIWVDGAHKSLPALTQGALVSVKNEKLIPALEEGLACFRTTSPSYPIMASVEYGLKYIANNDLILQKARAAVDNFRNDCPLKIYPSQDWTKLVVDFKETGVSSFTAEKILEGKGIYSEFSDGRYLLFYLSPTTTAKDMRWLMKALTAFKAEAENGRFGKDFKELPPVPEAKRSCGYLKALKSEKELIPLEKSEGRVCAANAGIAPPCIPVVAAGEIITRGAIKCLAARQSTFGLADGGIWVIK